MFSTPDSACCSPFAAPVLGSMGGEPGSACRGEDGTAVYITIQLSIVVDVFAIINV